MKILTTISEIRIAVRELRARKGSIALVPTMGALHAGHLSLVTRARAEADAVVASLFVNPLQFGPAEDFDRYPRDLDRDRQLFADVGVDLLFAPTVEQMVPRGAMTYVEVGPLGERLDGAHRPGHFRGVATIVAKLFHIVQPDVACFGQKDAVQVAVLRRMVRDLNFPVELIACPIVRDPDGLALSSRNAYLSAAERQTALKLPQALALVRAAIGSGIHKTKAALAPARASLSRDSLDSSDQSLALEYLEAVDPDTLEPVVEIAPGTLVAVAARVGSTRLIDNFLA